MAVVFDAKFTSTNGDFFSFGSSSFSINGATSGFTIGSGSNRAVVFQIALAANAGVLTVSSVTWDVGGTNQAATLIGRANDGAHASVELWGLVAPTSGNKTISVVASGTCDDFYVAAVSFTGADQTGGATTFPNFNSATGAGPVTLNVTSATGNAAVSCGIITVTSIATINQTQSFLDNSGGLSSGFGQYASGAATVTFSSTPSQNFTLVGCDILASAGGGQSPLDTDDFTVNPTFRPSYNQYWLESNTYLIGKDSRLAGKQNYILPPIGGTSNQYYIRCLNLELLSKDSTLAGKQRYDLPAGPTRVQDWQQSNQNLRSAVVSPIFPKVWPILQGILRTQDWQNTFFSGLSGQDSKLTGNQSYNNPVILPRSNPDWQLSYNNAINVVINPNLPFFWLNPTLPILRNQDWQDIFFLGLIGQDATVFGRSAGPNPTLSVARAQDWQLFNQSISVVIPVNPVFPPIWFVPKGLDPKVQDYQLDLNLEIQGQDFKVPGTAYYMLPTTVLRNPQDYQLDVNLAILGKDFVLYPANLPSYFNRVLPNQDWELPLSQTLLIIQAPPTIQSSLPQQFPPPPFDKTLYSINWAPFIPPPLPPPVESTPSGRYDEDYFTWKRWREGREILRKQVAAATLGRQGGIASGKSRRTR